MVIKGEWINKEVRYLVIQSNRGMSFAEIARQLDRNYKSVEVKVHKLRKMGVNIASKRKYINEDKA